MARRRPNRPDEQTLDVGGVAVNVAVGGNPDAPTLLLLHGLAARWQAFATLLPRLRTDWRIVAPDFRGHGCSGHAPGTYRLPRLVADTEAVMDRFCPDPPVIYGHSLGGWVALWLAATRDVEAVVVGDTAIQPRPVAEDDAINYMAGVGIAMKSMATAMQQLDPAVMTDFRTDALTAGYDPQALLPQVACPVLLLQADPEEGGLMHDDDVTLATQLLPRSTHVRLDGLGHGLHVQDPGRVIDAITAFLEERS